MSRASSSFSSSSSSSSRHYSPSAVDESRPIVSHGAVASVASTPFDQRDWIQRQHLEHEAWVELLSTQQQFYYPVALSGGKHENTFLCFADVELTCPFVLKLLPTSMTRLPVASESTGKVDPATLEWVIYQRLRGELDTGRIVHFPYVYHSTVLPLGSLKSFLVFADADAKRRLNEQCQLDNAISAADWDAFVSKQREPNALCLFMEYSMLTSVKAWYHRLRESMYDRRGSTQTQVNWNRLGLTSYVASNIDRDLRRLPVYTKYVAEEEPALAALLDEDDAADDSSDPFSFVTRLAARRPKAAVASTLRSSSTAPVWRPKKFMMMPEWKSIFALPSMKPVWQSLFFQVTFALEYLVRLFPGFRHFDLHSGNILMTPVGDETKFTGPTYMQYDVDGTIFYVPMVGIMIQMFDFDFASYDHVRNRKVVDQGMELARKHGIGPKTPSAYDTHLFFTSFQCQAHQLDDDTRTFLNDMVPTGYRMNQKYTVGKSARNPNGNRFRMSYKRRDSGDVPERTFIFDHPFLQVLTHRPEQGTIWPVVWRLPPAL